MSRPDRSTLFLISSVVIATFIGLYVALGHLRGASTSESDSDQLALQQIPFDGEQAYENLKRICALGPRPSGSDGMKRQQALLTEHFNLLGAHVSAQDFQVRHPQDGSPVPIRNLIVEWHPERTNRILLCAHYDTRPFPDRDRKRPQGVFVGANDGGSGVALLMELGRHMPGLQSQFGVDFVLFDAEELVYDDRRDKDYYFVGSTYFAQQYKANPPSHRYTWGVLLDMVADAELQLYQERNSLTYARPLVNDIWNTASRLRVAEFIRRPNHELRDDHLPLNEIARIPTCDIIDFDYPRPSSRQSYWHTEQDTPDKCSAKSLAKVGWVLLEWLKSVRLPTDQR